MKGINELRMDITKLNKQNNKITKKKNKLSTRVHQERQLVDNLKNICKRMQKGSRELGYWKESLKVNTLRQKKKREKLASRLYVLQQESKLFYTRAQREAYG